MRVLIVDNRDSFTFNLVDYVERLTGRRPTVVSHDTPWVLLRPDKFDAVIISPGPGHPAKPADVGLSAEVLERCELPILGVCLGMQLMVHAGGGVVGLAPEPMHGRLSAVSHDGSGLMTGIPSPYEVVRYHSLSAHSVPARFRVTARTVDDGIPMVIEDTCTPRWGVQFHPESIGDEWGLQLIANFLALASGKHPTPLGQWAGQSNAGRTAGVPTEPTSVPAHAGREEPTHNPFYCVRTVEGAVEPATVAQALRGNVFWLDAGRFSILGDDSGPRAHFVSYTVGSGDFFAQWKDSFAALRVPEGTEAPVPGCDFGLGWVGYLGYEMGQECGAAPMPQAPGPDAEFVFADRAVIIDHESNVTHLVSFAGDDEWELPVVPAHVETGAAAPDGAKPPATNTAGPVTAGPLTAVHSREEYVALIARSQNYIRWGETYELCLTNRWELECPDNLLPSFVKLRAANPSPRTGYLGFAGQQLASTTPELFLAVSHDGVVTSKPIKGTRPRFVDPSEDAAAAQDLATNPKDRSENLMIVDLVRHDLSRVCGDIRVPHFGAVESYSTVHQLVSTVTGQLRPGFCAIDALQAAFPGGSMTGAPKYRTMQLISELEGTWRGAYSGAFGYLSVTGAADFSMVIRTLVRGPHGGYYGVGGAILALSDPESEYEETVTKARPLTNFLHQQGAGQREEGVAFS